MRPQRRFAGKIEAAPRRTGERLGKRSLAPPPRSPAAAAPRRLPGSAAAAPQRVGKDRAQALVALHQVAQRRFQRATVERPRQAAALSECCRSRSALPGGRGTIAGAAQTTAEARPAGAAQQAPAGPRLTGIQMPGQRLNGGSFEHAADRNLDIKRGADAADQPHRQQRMTAKREEVVVDADPLQPQHLGKQPA